MAAGRIQTGRHMAAKAKQEEEAGDTPEEGAEGGAPKKKSMMKLIIMGVGALVVLGGGGAGAYMMLGGKRAEEKVAAAPVKPAAFFDMPDVLVNLSTTGSDRTQYLRVKIVLELPDATVAEKIKPVLPRVMDAFQTYLRELRPIDLEGSAGLYRLKDELTRRVNVAVAPNHVNAVLFKEIVVQ
jgi:flagellar protein FliL